jgi:Flp pilus assembly protein TadG
MGFIRDRELGVTLVEGAIVLPLLVLIVFTIMELGLAFKDFLTTDFAAKEGARVGALAGNDPEADCNIIQSIVAGYTATDLSDLAGITIFEVGSSGGPVGGTQNVWTLPAGADPAECDEWSQSAPLAWPSTDRDVTVAGGSDLDILGVTIDTRHDWVTGLPPWRGQIDIVRTAIQRLEPEAFE